MQRLIENLTLGMGAVGYLTESMHGAGSPQAQRIMIGRLANLEGKERLARQIRGSGSKMDDRTIRANKAQQRRAIEAGNNVRPGKP